MSPRSRHLLATVATLACATVLAACGGGGTKTVTAASVPSSSAETATTATTATTTAPAKTATATTPVTGAGGTPATTTRTAPEPAFTEHEQHSGAEGVRAAAALVREHGFTPDNVSEYHSAQTLRVLVGTRTGSGDGYGQQAFFFVDGRYIGTDTKEPSASVKVVSQAETEVTLAYPLYRPSDPLCCPGGGSATVHFQLNDGKLTALEPIPPASSKKALSRY